MADNEKPAWENSFASIPDVIKTSDGIEVIEQPKPPEEQPAPTAAPLPQAQYIPVPVPVQQGPDETTAYWMRQSIAAEQQRQQREWQAQQEREWAAMMAPPPLPENKDELLTNADKLAEVLDQRANWSAQLAHRMAAQNQAQTQELMREAAENRMARADLATEKARFMLHQQGVPDYDRYWGQVEGVLRNNPENYWQLRTNPQVLVEAVHMARRHAQMAAPPQVQPQQIPTAGYGGGQPSNLQQYVQMARGVRPDDLAKAEKIWGKFTPEMLSKRRAG